MLKLNHKVKEKEHWTTTLSIDNSHIRIKVQNECHGRQNNKNIELSCS